MAVRGWLCAVVTMTVSVSWSCSSSDSSETPVSPATPVVASIAVVGPADSLFIGDTFAMSATALDRAGHMMADVPIAWTSSNATVAAVAPTTGTVTAVALGSTVIAAHAGHVSSSTVVYVREHIGAEILPDGEFGDTIQIAPGETFQLFVYKYRFDPRGIGGSAFLSPAAPPIWTSSSSGAATVDDSGLVTGVAQGTTTIAVSIDHVVASRPIRIAATPGVATIRLVNAADHFPQVTLRPNTGAPVTLAYGDVAQQTVPAGTLQLSSDRLVLSSLFDFDFIDLQEYSGFLPASTRATFVAVSDSQYAPFSGPLTIAPLFDWTGPIPADSAIVRVVLATSGGFNVYIVPPGAPMSNLFLAGCYLDGPFGFTDYQTRVSGAFDIVLQAGKGTSGPESGRLSATAAKGHATTYIVTGAGSTLRVLSVVDR